MYMYIEKMNLIFNLKNRLKIIKKKQYLITFN